MTKFSIDVPTVEDLAALYKEGMAKGDKQLSAVAEAAVLEIAVAEAALAEAAVLGTFAAKGK